MKKKRGDKEVTEIVTKEEEGKKPERVVSVTEETLQKTKRIEQKPDEILFFKGYFFTQIQRSLRKKYNTIIHCLSKLAVGRIVDTFKRDDTLKDTKYRHQQFDIIQQKMQKMLMFEKPKFVYTKTAFGM